MKPSVTYPFQIFSCIIILVAFLWLTVGTSFLSIEKQKQLNNKTTSKAETDHSKKASGPFENATEEKTETSPNTISEEYLREDTEHFSYTDIPLQHNKCHFADAFIAYYGESASQPPETLFC